MSENQIFIVIIVACLIIMGVAMIVKKTDLIAVFIIKAALGVVSIYFMNEVLGTLHVNLSVGMNLGTALTIGVFGVPGFLLLYFLAVYDHFI